MSESNIAPYTPPAPSNLGFESNLSGYVGPYVTDMLGRGRAAASQPYIPYTGPLTAGATALQDTVTTGLSGLTDPTTGMGTYTPMSFTADLETPYDVTDPLNEEKTRTIGTVAEQYMNPYLQASLRPQLDELTRQATIQRLGNAQRLTGAGAYGGSRQAIMDAELDRNLLRSQSDVLDKGYASAYDKGIAQFNREQDAQRMAQDFANRYGFDVLSAQAQAGEAQRGILSEGIKADYGQFIEERDYPLKSTQYMQSLLQELPLEARQTMYSEPSSFSQGMGATGGILGLLKDLGLL
jgi:hypothetical protein